MIIDKFHQYPSAFRMISSPQDISLIEADDSPRMGQSAKNALVRRSVGSLSANYRRSGLGSRILVGCGFNPRSMNRTCCVCPLFRKEQDEEGETFLVYRKRSFFCV